MNSVSFFQNFYKSNYGLDNIFANTHHNTDLGMTYYKENSCVEIKPSIKYTIKLMAC